MDEFVEPEIFEGELKKEASMFRLCLTCRGKLIGDFEILIENRLDGIRCSSSEDILGIRDKFCGDTEDIGSRTGEIIRKRSSSIH